MKINLLLSIVFISVTILAYSSFQNNFTERIGGTELNDNGFGCACHSLEKDLDVIVRIEGPDTLIAGEMGIYKMFMSGGPALGGGYNVAARFATLAATDTFSVWDYRSPNELTQAFPLIFPTTADTLFWEFGYIAPDSVSIDTIYSTGLSTNNDGIPTDLDKWNYGPKFPVVILNSVPVELISFTAEQQPDKIKLSWKTSTEVNNKGFEIERMAHSAKGIAWEKIAFVEGNGTTTEMKEYSFMDNLDLDLNLDQKIKYRLKQIDFDGSFEYSNEIEIEVNILQDDFVLYQNYPNPFNPKTNFEFRISNFGFVTLKVYDILGKEIAMLVNEFKEPGEYEVEFSTDAVGNGTDISSGIYFYTLSINGFNQTKKMLLLR